MSRGSYAEVGRCAWGRSSCRPSAQRTPMGSGALHLQARDDQMASDGSQFVVGMDGPAAGANDDELAGLARRARERSDVPRQHGGHVTFTGQAAYAVPRMASGHEKVAGDAFPAKSDATGRFADIGAQGSPGQLPCGLEQGLESRIPIRARSQSPPPSPPCALAEASGSLMLSARSMRSSRSACGASPFVASSISMSMYLAF